MCVPAPFLATEHEIDPSEHEIEPAPRKMTDALDEERSIDGDDLRHVGHGILASPVVRAGSRTLPGASAQWRLLVSGVHTTVEMRLRLNGSPCTTITGSRRRGHESIVWPT